jgi:hypothetical protein
MTVVWIRGMGGVLVRADAVVVLEVAEDGLWAECVSGRVVRLTGARCPEMVPLALLEEIRRAGGDDRWAVVLTPPAEQESLAWRCERVQDLLP